jgi:two-component system LytT family response regulator
MPVIIFVTAYDQYALKAFEVSALDYLLKPFDDIRFHKALAQARRQIEQQDASELGRKLLTLMGSREIRPGAPRYVTRIMVKTAGRVIFIRADEIDWIEAYDNYLRLHVGGKAHLLRQTMNELEAALNPDQFARIHRSTIVNLDRVKELRPHVNEYVVILQDGTELKLSRTRREWLEQWLGNQHRER